MKQTDAYQCRDSMVFGNLDEALHHERVLMLIEELSKYDISLETIKEINTQFHQVKDAIIKVEKMIELERKEYE